MYDSEVLNFQDFVDLNLHPIDLWVTLSQLHSWQT